MRQISFVELSLIGDSSFFTCSCNKGEKSAEKIYWDVWTGRVVLELDHFAVLNCRETRDVQHTMLPGHVLGNGGLKGPSAQRGIALNWAFVRSLFVTRLSEGLMVRVLRNAVSGWNAARQAVKTASSLAAVLPSLDGR